MQAENKILIYEDAQGNISLDVSLDGDTIWLSQKQLEILYDINQSGISRHLSNIFKTGELEKESNMQKMHIANSDKPVSFYNLDVIISVGYRVNSKKATAFRIWATKILKQHITKGYTLNEKMLSQNSLDELNQTLTLLKNTISNTQLELLEAKGLLDVIINYTRSWSLLQAYDEDSLNVTSNHYENKFILDFSEAKTAIKQLKSTLKLKGEATELFAREKANEFEGIIRNIYQTFGGIDLLPSIEEKAANLLYYIIKDHPFNDGNKRIGAFLFILFLSKNNMLYKKNGELKINDNALVAITLMTAKSAPEQKNTLIKLIINILEE